MFTNYWSRSGTGGQQETPSYSTSSEDAERSYREELEQREQRQQRHYELLRKVQQLASDLPL